jgi:hypothetical protein
VRPVILPAQNVAIQTPQRLIDPVWYEKLKAWEGWINLTSAIFPSGPATPTTPATLLTASLPADRATNATTYTDGPSVAQGASGTWFVSGTVSLVDTAAARTFSCKLWDGTTVIASCSTTTSATSFSTTVSLSGYIISPAGNLRISVIQASGTTGKMLFNQTGNSKDSTISAFRIG